MKTTVAPLALSLVAGLLAAPAPAPLLAEQAPPRRDVPFVPTPDEVVEEMLDLAKVTKRDIVYDLGSGDGRIVIAAARRGARAVGVDIDPARVADGKLNAREAGVSDRARFIEGDLFDTDLGEATVVTLYLLPDVNMRLRPKLLSELRPGTRIVSHAFDMGDWKPRRTKTIGGSTVFLWTVPKNRPAAAGRTD